MSYTSYFSKIPKSALFIVFIICALANFLVFGLPHVRSWADAQGYDAYAANIVTGHGYSTDGTTFSDLREPGYPFFVAAIYGAFGVHNLLAVALVQTLLLGILGYIMYLSFAYMKWEFVGALAGLAVVLLPSYGYYADEILTELLFTFMLGLIFYLCVRVLQEKEYVSWTLVGLLGLACALGTLVREQLLFFLPFLIVCFLIAYRNYSWNLFKKILLACVVFCLIIAPWVAYVHANTGTYEITDGRIQLSLYARADRAALSYRDITRYAVDWLRQSISGGQGTTFLQDNDYHVLYAQYANLATTSAAVSAIEKQNIATILSNPGHYLYGNLVEVMKLGYIEHDYSNYINRYVRAGMYIFVYGFCLFGLYWLFRRGDKQIKAFSILSLLFIFYNYLVLTPFDTIPRYNTPYLMFYMVIGFAGCILFYSSRKAT